MIAVGFQLAAAIGDCERDLLRALRGLCVQRRGQLLQLRVKRIEHDQPPLSNQ
jgi:hypothetical protein